MKLVSELDRRGPISTKSVLRYGAILLGVAFALISLSLLFFNIAGLARSTFALPEAYGTYVAAFSVLFLLSLWMFTGSLKFRLPTNWHVPGIVLFLFFLLMGIGGYFVGAAYQRIPSEISYANGMYLYSAITVISGILFLAAALGKNIGIGRMKIFSILIAILGTILAYVSMSYQPAKLFTVDPTIVAFLNMEYAPAGFYFFGFFGSYGLLGLVALVLGLFIVLLGEIQSFRGIMKRMDSLTLVPLIFYSVGALISGITVLTMPLFNDLSLYGRLNGSLPPIGSTNASLAAFKIGQILGMAAASALIVTGALLLAGTLFIAMEVVKQVNHAGSQAAD